MNANQGKVTMLSELICDNDMYHDNDAWMSDFFKENKLTTNDSEKDYTFIYMHGCHSPHILDENGDISDNATVTTQVIGSFKTVKMYLQHLKDIGAYDNSTIIISGDHGIPNRNETVPLFDDRDSGVTTAMMIKPRNAERKPLKKSSAEVSVNDILPTIVKDAGIKTDKDYGKSVFDISENEHRTRTFYQSVYNFDNNKLVLNKYEINGKARDAESWKLLESVETKYTWY